jgi:PAS domain S-box-containing protein
VVFQKPAIAATMEALVAEPSLRENGATEYASRAYLEAALDCVVIADLSGRVVEFNPAAERTFGYTREQALGRTLGELIVPPSLRERHSRAFARFAETHEETLFGRRVELTGMRADGSEFPVELTLTRVEGEPLLICGALRDISEAKRAREDLRRLAEEQAALHRVAILVAREAGPQDVFAAVAEEARRVLGLPMIEMSRYENDGTVSVIGASGGHPFQAGTRWPLDGPTTSTLVLKDGRPARVDDYTGLPGAIAKAALEAGIRAAVGVPIFVDRRLWGVMATGAPDPLPADTEERLADFTELIGTAISNTQARSELIASRARIVTAGDAARRRLERDLHDGIQQRLVAIGLDLQTVRAATPTEQQHVHTDLDRIARDIEGILEDVRELSRGLHPALLSQRGLGPALRTLSRKSPIEVDLDIDIAQRPPESLEVAVYYVASEALTNAAKHSRASRIAITVATSDAVLRATIADNGIGGAEASTGSGLVGLIDRVEALGGRLALHSPPGVGTTISLELPLAAHPAGDVEGGRGGAHGRSHGTVALQPELLEVADATTLLTAVVAAADALYVVDAQGRIRFLNAAALRILGYDDERQLLGLLSHDTIHFKRLDGTPFAAAECPLHRPRINGDTVRVEDDAFVQQDGSLIRVAYSSAPISLVDGHGAVVSFRDISDRPRADSVLSPTP